MQKISDNVYVESGFRGCNVTMVVTTDGVVLIDTPEVPTEAMKWRDEALKFGPIRYVINTEPHIDHVSGNCFLGGIGIAHEGTRQAIMGLVPSQLEDMLKRMAPESLPLDKNFHFQPPSITLSQQLTLYLGKHTFKLTNLPGHSPYQVAVFIPEERVVCTSDNVVNGNVPYFHQAIPDVWLESLQRLGQFDADKFVPGHGAVCDRSYLPEMSAMIQAWITAAKNAISAGMSLEEAREKLPLPEKYAKMGGERMPMVRRMNVTRLYEVFGASSKD
jgi:cyclase